MTGKWALFLNVDDPVEYVRWLDSIDEHGAADLIRREGPGESLVAVADTDDEADELLESAPSIPGVSFRLAPQREWAP